MKSIHINNNDLSTIRNIREHLYEYLLVFPVIRSPKPRSEASSSIFKRLMAANRLRISARI